MPEVAFVRGMATTSIAMIMIFQQVAVPIQGRLKVRGGNFAHILWFRILWCEDSIRRCEAMFNGFEPIGITSSFLPAFIRRIDEQPRA